MGMDPSLEIRKLTPRPIRDITQILETHEMWKRLMAIIPKTLLKDNFVCDVTLDNPHKYNSEHFKLIESASEKYRKPCTEILLDEWGTSGRVRPTVGHLLYLLTKAKLFRAADYVAVDLLNRERPQRPSSGPEALISVALPGSDSSNTSNERDKELEEAVRTLDSIGYINTAVSLIRSTSEQRTRQHNNAPTVIPEIIISPDIDEDNNRIPNFTLPLVVQKEKTVEIVEESGSDMIKFSTEVVSTISNNLSGIDVRPEISQLLNEVSESNLPDVCMSGSLNVASFENSETDSSTSDVNEVPAFSQLMTNETSRIEVLPEQEPVIPNLSILNNSMQDSVPCDNLPNLTLLNINQESVSDVGGNISNIIPDIDALNSDINNAEVALPNISGLGIALPSSGASNPSRSVSVNTSTHLLPTLLNTSQNSSDNSTKSRSCTSPLPNLSLNTLLPHFSYPELENATNKFNVAPYKGLEESGRFLGSGAFGSVFLAAGLLDRHVAVKKLILKDVEVVNVDDDVTKQFRNEVEVLSKYKHENLLSLLGYSCDGCTYCLLYEYISGGALKDRLQVIEGKLQWTERLSIATGTSKAVSYLHTAFITPLIHRDIKSANILLDSKNNAKLSDFGLIKLTPSQNTNTATTVSGTSAYMAPEAFRGDVSVKSDTFSFGVVLLELLTSLPPLDENREGSDLVTHVEDTCENDITPLLDETVGCWKEGDINFAAELFSISRQCLQEKKKRPNMVEVCTQLKELLNKICQ
ncbi:hypothetical protein NQ315_005196 [Exocentrus adspersus]|uniref:non-specific serine/threonine protein kinase n=1 Tax=Exocentrus adspersus TaxID=1586481 RepID=A0AAV8VUF3_9CUCU|nr:hypothetical protein NQ315_005196 [Exocentrus adspersus]